jgi:hypothetical protein
MTPQIKSSKKVNEFFQDDKDSIILKKGISQQLESQNITKPYLNLNKQKGSNFSESDMKNIRKQLLKSAFYVN